MDSGTIVFVKNGENYVKATLDDIKDDTKEFYKYTGDYSAISTYIDKI
jgi:hypothetical protein